MSINLDNIFLKPAFDSITQERKDALKALITKIEGKNPIEIINLVKDFNTSNTSGENLSKAELKEMVAASIEEMNEEEKKKFMNLAKMFSMM